MPKRISCGEKIRRMRKLVKRGHSGYGTELSDDMTQYIMDTMKTAHSQEMDVNEKRIFVNNVVDEFKNDFINICCNQFGSQCIEALLPLANDEKLSEICKLVASDFRVLATNVYGSRVFQQLLIVVYPMVNENESLANFIQKCTKFLFNNSEEFMSHTNANFLIRTILTITKDHRSTVFLLNELVNEFIEQVINWPSIQDYPFNNLTAGFLNIFLQTVRVMNFSHYKTLIKKLRKSCLRDIDRVIKFNTAIHVYETIMVTCKEKQLTSIYKKQLRGRLIEFINERKTCYLVHKLLKQCTRDILFCTIIEELFDNEINCFDICLQKKYDDIILTICQKSAELKEKQSFIQMKLMDAFECSESTKKQVEFLKCLLTMTKLSEYSDNKELPINVIGALIMQSLLKFKKPIIFVRSFLELNITDLLSICSNQHGSFIMDTFMQSDTIGAKNRQKLTAKLIDHFPDLLQNKYGSRSFDAIWTCLTLTESQRLEIIGRLKKGRNLWMNSFYGNIIVKKLRDWFDVKSEAEARVLMNKNALYVSI